MLVYVGFVMCVSVCVFLVFVSCLVCGCVYVWVFVMCVCVCVLCLCFELCVCFANVTLGERNII